MNELDKKLAEWAGFEWKTLTWKMSRGFPNRDFTGWWKYDNFTTKLNFTESLDACFKWLVPKVKEGLTLLYIHFDAPYDENEEWYCSLSSDYARKMQKWVGEGKTPALALCEAIEKVIDNES